MKKHNFIKAVSISFLILYTFIFIYDDCTHYKEKEIDTSTLQKYQYIPWGIRSIIKDEHLRNKLTGKRIKIAILDSGINYNHPDFGSNIKCGYNTINPNRLPIDDNGHGTLVTGIIGAQNNKFGIVGIAPEAEIYPVKVLDKYGEGDIKNVVEGINWCIVNKIEIINMSFSILKDEPFLKSSIKKAIDAGILVVASAYNSYGHEVGYPAAYNEVISVTAVDSEYKIGKMSPRGKLGFSAPGVDILSTTISNGYEYCNGTSYAAPYVSGTIALILENPQLFGLSKQKTYSYTSIYNTLKRMSKHLGWIGRNSTFGQGFITIYY